jgi:hypothetical protein
MNSNYDDVITNTTQPQDNNSITGWFKWLFFNRYMLIIIILAFLGINLLSYLDYIVKAIVGLFRPLLALFGYTIGETAKETVKIVKTGSNDIIDVTAGTLTGGINLLEKGLTGGKKGIGAAANKPQLKNILPKKPKSSSSTFPMPDDAGSRTQASKAKSNAGYCYIGEDRGFRSCIQVNDSDTCMSGDIFPTQDICINPKLRQ